MRISIGDSTRGYDSAEVTKVGDKYRLVAGTVVGREYAIRAAIAALNRGDSSYVSSAGDYWAIKIDGRARA